MADYMTERKRKMARQAREQASAELQRAAAVASRVQRHQNRSDVTAVVYAQERSRVLYAAARAAARAARSGGAT